MTTCHRDILLPYTIVTITGPDAEKFLQGQLSCDLVTLKDEVIYGTANTPKGRMVGLFKIARFEQGFLLRIHKESAQSLVDHLAKYQVFFKCETHIRPDYQVIGSIEKTEEMAISSMPENPMINTSVSEDCVEYSLCSKPFLREKWLPESESEPSENEEQINYWLCLETQLGLPELYPNTLDHFILQHLNLHQLNAVSFKKGCYTGQEIIARMKFLGQLKKNMFLLSSESTSLTHDSKAGDTVFNSEGGKLGELVRIHYHPNLGTLALAVLPVSVIESETEVYLDGASGVPFQLNKLQYA